MSIIGFSFINDFEFMMPVIVKVVGEKSFENLITSVREVTVV